MTPRLTSLFTLGLTRDMTAEQTSTGPCPTPQEFLAEVATAEPGWADRHGGPTGIVTLCADLQEQIARQSEQIAAVRVAAIQELLKTRSGTNVAATFGVSKAAISKTSRANTWKGATW